MKLRTCSVALVALVVGTSAWADDSAFDPSNFVDCSEDTFLAQVLETSSMPTAVATAQIEQASEDDRIAAIVDSIVRNTINIGSLPPPVWDEPTIIEASFGPADPADVTGSLRSVEIAPDGYEDR
jgi:predicted permease